MNHTYKWDFSGPDFSNTVKETDIKGMAEADDHEAVKELQVLTNFQLILNIYHSLTVNRQQNYCTKII